MGRLKELRKYINTELEKMENADERGAAYVHLYGVSLAATILAKKRGQSEELAAMAAMLHDLHAYKTGSYDDHAHKGAELAREILNELKLTTDEETDIICSAIYHHDDKYSVDGPMDELLKDADVISHTMNDSSKPIKEKEQERYDAICAELGLRNKVSKLIEEIDEILVKDSDDEDYDKHDEIFDLRKKHGWEEVQEALIQILLDDDRSMQEYKSVAIVFWYAVLENKERKKEGKEKLQIRKKSIIGLLYHRLRHDEQAENLIWSITCELYHLDYCNSLYNPMKDEKIISKMKHYGIDLIDEG